MPENRVSTVLQTSSHALVVGAGVVYLFGFVIVSIHDASFGIADFSLFRTKAIAVGCLFGFLVALPIVVTFRTFRILGLERPRITAPQVPTKPENRPYRIADAALSLPFVCYGVIATPIAFLFRKPFLIFAEHFAGHAGNHRSCRMPLVENIQAEFHGDKAKLIWVVSLDGKKMQSETYKVLAVLDKPKNEQK